MTVLSLQHLLARPRRPAIVTRRLGPARCPVPRERRTYPDLFFADPGVVEDDSRRMRPGT
jgi:hypothetical protein